MDEVEDFEFVAHIYGALYADKQDFTYDDIVHFCQANPDILQLNAKYTRNEGLKKSLQEDEVFMNETLRNGNSKV